MLCSPELIRQAKLLLKHGKHQALRSWFVNVEDKKNTERVTVNYKDDTGAIQRVVINTGVPRERIDKVLIWCSMFMREHFRDPTPDFQREIVALILSPQNQYLGAPRGFSKTTTTQGVISFLVAHGLEKFIALIEKTFSEAAEVLKTVHDEFAGNELIIGVYGNLFKTAKNLKLEVQTKERDAQGDMFINGVRLKGKGFESSIRGLKSGAWRPTLIICDDLEKDEHINNPDQRAKYFDRYKSSILPAVDPVAGRVKVMGTILHLDSLLSNLIKLHHGKIFRAFYDDSRLDWSDVERKVEMHDGRAIKLLWPERWPYQLLMSKKEEMLGKGQSTHAFSKEYLNDPAGDEDRQFKSSWLWNPYRRITLDAIKKSPKIFNGYCAIDTADSTRAGSDFTGAIVHLVDSQLNHYRVFVRRVRINAPELIDLIFEIWGAWHKFGLLKIGVEKKAFEDQVRPTLEQEMTRRKEFPVVEELKPFRRSKESRILGNLQGRYQQGKIWSVGQLVGEQQNQFVSEGHTEALLDELSDFPNADHDDLSDAEAYCVEMAEAPLNNQDGSVQKVRREDGLDTFFDTSNEPVLENTRDDPFG